MRASLSLHKPARLPFLEAICWDLSDISHLSYDEMLGRYERGWQYEGVLADLEGDEKVFLQQLAGDRGSWLQVNV